jgi:hypothetical protein
MSDDPNQSNVSSGFAFNDGSTGGSQNGAQGNGQGQGSGQQYYQGGQQIQPNQQAPAGTQPVYQAPPAQVYPAPQAAQPVYQAPPAQVYPAPQAAQPVYQAPPAQVYPAPQATQPVYQAPPAQVYPAPQAAQPTYQTPPPAMSPTYPAPSMTPPMGGAGASGTTSGSKPPTPPAKKGGKKGDAGDPNYLFGEKMKNFTTSVVLPDSALNFDRAYFLNLLAGSISLTKAEKTKIINSIPKLRQAQVDELIRIFEEERTKFIELSKKHGKQLKKLEDEHFADWKDIEIEIKSASQSREDSDKADDLRKQLGL